MSTDEIGLPVSPLVERAIAAAIPGALSRSKYTVCDGATIVSTEPLSIKMPQARWAYGVHFPLDHTALRRMPTDASCVAQVKLVVDGGPVGVAACNADGTSFTTPEMVASGSTEILSYS